MVQGGTVIAFGLLLLGGRLYYGHTRDTAVDDTIAGPLIDNVLTMFNLLAGVFVALGIFVIVRAMRRAATARRGTTGIIDGSDG